jgi:hypothetical protein
MLDRTKNRNMYWMKWYGEITLKLNRERDTSEPLIREEEARGLDEPISRLPTSKKQLAAGRRPVARHTADMVWRLNRRREQCQTRMRKREQGICLGFKLAHYRPSAPIRTSRLDWRFSDLPTSWTVGSRGSAFLLRAFDLVFLLLYKLSFCCWRKQRVGWCLVEVADGTSGTWPISVGQSTNIW